MKNRKSEMLAWERKAHDIIKSLAWDAYKQAGNKPGKKHKTYWLPTYAEELVKCLGMRDREEAEKRAKALFAMYHDGTYKDYGVAYLLGEGV